MPPPSASVVSDSARRAVVLRQPAGDSQVFEGDGDAGEDLEHAIDPRGINVGFVGAFADDRDAVAVVVGQIEIAFDGGVFLA